MWLPVVVKAMCDNGQCLLRMNLSEEVRKVRGIELSSIHINLD